MANLKPINASKENPLKSALYGVQEKVSAELSSLQNIVKLAAFAFEARRTLEAYEDHSESHPGFKKQFEACTPFSSNWREFDGIVSAEVLRDVANRMGTLSEEICEDHNVIEKQFAQG